MHTASASKPLNRLRATFEPLCCAHPAWPGNGSPSLIFAAAAWEHKDPARSQETRIQPCLLWLISTQRPDWVIVCARPQRCFHNLCRRHDLKAINSWTWKMETVGKSRSLASSELLNTPKPTSPLANLPAAQHDTTPRRIDRAKKKKASLPQLSPNAALPFWMLFWPPPPIRPLRKQRA